MSAVQSGDPAVVPAVSGTVSRELEPLKSLLQLGIAEAGEVGCALSVYVDGECVCDLWCGEAAAGRPWQPDTLTVVYSVGKGMLALCAQMLVERGELDIERPVATYWPEFAQAGKEAITVRQLLNHTAGVLTFPRFWEVIGRDGSGIEDWEMMVERLAAAPPALPPGAEVRYHTMTFGYLVGEVVRRVSGVTPGGFFATEIAAPLGLQATIGTPPALRHRIAELMPQPQADPASDGIDPLAHAFAASRDAIAAGDAYAPAALLFGSPMFLHPDIDYAELAEWVPALFNRREILQAEIPSSNAVCDARSLARMYGALAQGGRIAGVELVSPGLVEAWSTPEDIPGTSPSGERFGLGYHTVTSTARPTGLRGRAFGHGGTGGNLAFADPALGLGFAYVKNRALDGSFARRMVDATYQCLAAERGHPHGE